MTIQQLDAIFPYFVFFYGALLTFVLHNDFLTNLAKEKFPPQLVAQMNGHRALALCSLFVGGLWSLQHLWLK